MNNDIELWKDIPGYYGLYRVSTHGRIKSMERIIKYGSKDKIVRARYMKPSVDKDGYHFVQLSKDGIVKNQRVHRLVAECFIRCNKNGNIINHKDFNPQNNHYSNLEWCTHEYNMQYSARNGRKIAKNRKLSKQQADEIISVYKSGKYTMDEIGAMYNVSRPVIGSIVNLKTYTK